MEKKDFLLILVALIILSGGYYLYANNIWPFGSSSNVPEELSSKVFVVGGVAKEIYDTVLVIQIPEKVNGLATTELMAVINDSTNVFRYETSPSGSVVPIKVSAKNIKVGDKIAVTCDEDIASKVNGVFLASSIAVYNQ